jgi:excinuclease ABC subunit B
MIQEIGYCKGIENYSRHFTGRAVGQPPPTLLDFFPKDALFIVDESHATLPQTGGMQAGDRSRKENLIQYGFRLPSAFDNRPLSFSEFEQMVPQAIYVSATPGSYEIEKSGFLPHPISPLEGERWGEGEGNDDCLSSTTNVSGALARSVGAIEQVIRPTGRVVPEVIVRPAVGQVEDLLSEIRKVVEQSNRILVTTLTKRMAEDLTDHYHGVGIKVRYLHSEIKTIERTEIIRDLRMGRIDVLIGINLLREGLDLPEVSLVAVLDADKEGFLRSARSLIQTAGRAARNVTGRVLLYADNVTESMRKMMDETYRRRMLQKEYNQQNGITPESIRKGLSESLSVIASGNMALKPATTITHEEENLSEPALFRHIQKLERQMEKAAKRLDFEEAATIRDRVRGLKEMALGLHGD